VSSNCRRRCNPDSRSAEEAGPTNDEDNNDGSAVELLGPLVRYVGSHFLSG